MEIPEILPVGSPTSDPSLEPEAIPDADSPPGPDTAAVSGGLQLSNDEFQRRVKIVMQAIKDPEKKDRCIAEIHTYLSMFEQGFREMQNEMIAGGGPMVMIRKMLLGR